MDLNNSYWREFISESLKNMQRLGETFFDRRCLKEATLPSVIPQPHKFRGHQPWKVLTFLSELEDIDDQIDQEIKFNVLLADILNFEYAFFIHKQDKKDCYLLRTIGGVKLENPIQIILPVDSMVCPTNDVRERLTKDSFFNNVILDSIQKPIMNMEFMNGCSEENEVQYPFMLVLLNKYLILSKDKLDTKVEKTSRQPKRISADISIEDKVLINDLMRLLSPIMNVLFYEEDASAFLKWIPEISRGMKIQFKDQSTWLNYATETSKRILNQNGIKINMAEHVNKFLKENPNRKENSNELNNNKLIQIFANDGMISQLRKGKEQIQLKKSLFYREISRNGFSVSALENTYNIPLLAANELLGVFQILRKVDFISPQDMEKAYIIAIICTFGIANWELQQ